MFNALLLLSVLLLHLFLFVVPQPDFFGYSCIDTNGNYTKGSTYESNLKKLFSEISSNTQISYGFYNFTVGKEPDQVNGFGLCRGDVTAADCHTCLNDSIHKIADVCPNQKEAIGWYDRCTLRYSNRSIFGVDDGYPFPYVCNPGNAPTDQGQFSQVLGALLQKVQSEAASGNSSLKFATGESNVTAFMTLYALAQCTPDLSRLDCFNSLGGSIYEVLGLCGTHLGGRVLGSNCNLRYEIYEFTESGNSSSPPESPPSGNTEKRSKSPHIVIIVAVSASASLILVSTLILCCLYHRRQRGMLDNNRLNIAEGVSTIESLQLDFSAVATATDNFSDANRLGHGGFGTVYKGRLSNGTEIAVKRLATSPTQGRNEFMNEVSLLAKLQHRNLVKLHGFCLEEEERILIYEFVPNKSLDYFLFDASKQANLSWETRYKIILGVARGLLYLHEDSRLTIIHRDLKANNILLDSEMNPKISDFGLARLFHDEQTHADTSNVAGTYGYMAPEYVFTGIISVKADVYSFGILVLEIISGRSNCALYGQENDEGLITLMWKLWKDGRSQDIIDLMPGSRDQIMKCLQIGLLCAHDNAADRPSISSVVLMLNSQSLTLSEPFKPAFLNDGLMAGELAVGTAENTGGNLSSVDSGNSLAAILVASSSSQSAVTIPEYDEASEDEFEGDSIRIPPQLKVKIRRAWRRSIIIRPLGKPIGYSFLRSRLAALWKLKGELSMIDLAKGDFAIRVTNMDDYERILLGGPWIVAGQYVLARQWMPNYLELPIGEESIAVWVRLPELDPEYLDEDVLGLIAPLIGRLLKIDINTTNQIRGQFARMCVEVNLGKPLRSKFQYRGKIHQIQYENLENICFACGRYGHDKAKCPELGLDAACGRGVEQAAGDGNVDAGSESYGEWMVVKKRRRRQG